MLLCVPDIFLFPIQGNGPGLQGPGELLFLFSALEHALYSKKAMDEFSPDLLIS